VSDANSTSGPRTDLGGDPPAGGESGSVHVILDPARTRVVLCGDVDAAIGGDLIEAAADAEAARRPVEVDTRRVTFMDSSGIALIARLASRTPGRLRVIRPPDVVRFLLDVTHIGEIVDVVDADPGVADRPPEPPDRVA
jgi:anti-sigma B factor antagonist